MPVFLGLGLRLGLGLEFGLGAKGGGRKATTFNPIQSNPIHATLARLSFILFFFLLQQSPHSSYLHSSRHTHLVPPIPKRVICVVHTYVRFEVTPHLFFDRPWGAGKDTFDGIARDGDALGQ